MLNLLLYVGFLSIVTCRILHNDKYLSLDKYKDNDTIYFDPVKVHVVYGNLSEYNGVKENIIQGDNSTKLYGNNMNRVVDEFITTTSASLNNSEEESDEDDDNGDNFDLLIDPIENFNRAKFVGGLRFTTIMCEVNGEFGVCTPSGYYCRNINGVVISVSGNNGGCGLLPCCQLVLSCGSSSNKKISHFVNPVDKIHASCGYTINVMNENVCQIRLDFLTFDIARPRQQTDTINTPISCRDDSFVINTSNGFRVPIICGYNTGQHLYLPVNASNGEKNVYLSMFLAVKRLPTFPNPTWKIRITQYECPNNPLAVNQSPRPYKDFLHLAPPGCLQYFTNRVGTVCNLGFQSGLGYNYNFYPANTKYAICFKRSPSTCGIKFTTSFFMLSSNNDCTMGDYLFIPGALLRYEDKIMRTNSRLCGNELPINAEILSNLEGPLYIQFESDNIGNDNEHGFCLDYEAPPAGGCT